MTAKPQTHELLEARKDTKMGSEKSFGLVFAAVFAIITFFFHSWMTGAIALIFLVVSFLKPSLLKPLNIAWFKFGLLLHKIISPLIMLFVYILAIIPTGLMLKLFGKDLLRFKLEKDQDSYWIHLEEKEDIDFKTQF